MRTLAFTLLFLMACSDKGSNNTLILDVGAGDTLPPSCNPLTQTGCDAGEKCTWINDQDNPPIGHVGCAPEGGVGGTPLALGAACTDPVAGPMGYDDCMKGTVCLTGECKQICDVNGGAPTCDANHACSRYADFFESGGTAVAGVCDPGCDPLTQDLKIGTNKVACGSPNASMPSKGCYGFSEYSCAPAGSTSWPLTDRMMPRTNAAGNPYLNGCAPGFIPLFYEMTGSTKTLCTGFCSALEIDNRPNIGTPPLTPAQRAKGNPAALGKLPLSAAAVAGDATCNADKKGSEASSQCHFLWWYLEDTSTGELPAVFDQGPYRDTLGVCMAISHFMYDSDMDMTPDTQYPDCATLPPRSSSTTGDTDDAADWGCQLRANSMFASSGKTRVNPAMKNIRMPKQTEMELVRHRLD